MPPALHSCVAPKIGFTTGMALHRCSARCCAAAAAAGRRQLTVHVLLNRLVVPVGCLTSPLRSDVQQIPHKHIMQVSGHKTVTYRMSLLWYVAPANALRYFH